MMLWSAAVWALPSGIASIIAQSGISKQDISLYIKEAGRGGRVVASLNANKTRTPASVIKVLTTYAALLELGFDYRWSTAFYRTGRLSKGVLHGDIIIKGYGDPTLNDEVLPQIVSRIKAAGIRKITGNIVIDRSYFHVGNRNTSGFDKYRYSPYNAMPDAMMYNERVSTICVEPRARRVTKKTPDRGFIVRNRLRFVNRPCRGRYAWPQVKVDSSQAVPCVWLKGSVSKRCGTQKICKVLTKSYLSFYYALKSALRKQGIKVGGRLRLRRLPKHATLLFTHYSKPLEEIVAKTAKESNNLYARHLLLLLGAKRYGAPATVAKGRKAVRYILRKHGALKSPLPYIDNGSGLSRTAKITATTLAGVLDHAYSHYGMRWMQTLSIAGEDGTIEKRFRDSFMDHRAWMKTGTLKHVKNIAGYVKGSGGRYYTVVILVNSKFTRKRAAKMQNEIIEWLAKYKGKGRFAGQIPKPFSSFAQVNHAMGKAGDYFIQVGHFKRYPGKVYLESIKSLSLPYKVSKGNDFKVLLGPFKEESYAREILAKVRRILNKHAFLLLPH